MITRITLISRVGPIVVTLALLVAGMPTAQAQMVATDAGTAPPGPPEVAVPAPVFSFSLTGASNYIFRGVSQTEDNAAVFGGAKVSYDHFYLAAGAENVDFHNGINVEYDLSGGWAPSLGQFKLNLGAIRYGYIGAAPGAGIDTIELHGGVSRSFGPIKLGGAINYAFNYFGTNRPAIYYEGKAAYQITPRLRASGVVGRQQIDAGNSYTTWNLGAAYAFDKHIGVGLRYTDTDTDAHADGRLYHHHVVASVTVGF